MLSTLSRYLDIFTLKGSDKEGSFDCVRRYKDFRNTRNALLNKWPGCYIPPLPPKKATGNLDKSFVDERKKMLDKFVKEIGLCPHLFESKEF